jgi:hypothetical protein
MHHRLVVIHLAMIIHRAWAGGIELREGDKRLEVVGRRAEAGTSGAIWCWHSRAEVSRRMRRKSM